MLNDYNTVYGEVIYTKSVGIDMSHPVLSMVVFTDYKGITKYMWQSNRLGFPLLF